MKNSIAALYLKWVGRIVEWVGYFDAVYKQLL